MSKYECGHCGRAYDRFEARILDVDVCHPDDGNLPDCYRLVGVFGEVLGARCSSQQPHPAQEQQT